MKKSREGLTMMEILTAMIFMAVAVGIIYSLFSFSSRGTLDAYRETLAYTLAQEGLERYAGLGYDVLRYRLQGLQDELHKELNRFVSVRELNAQPGNPVPYPSDYLNFERRIDIKRIPNRRLMRITVTVQPSGRAFFRRGQVILEKIVGGEFGW